MELHPRYKKQPFRRLYIFAMDELDSGIYEDIFFRGIAFVGNKAPTKERKFNRTNDYFVKMYGCILIK